MLKKIGNWAFKLILMTVVSFSCKIGEYIPAKEKDQLKASRLFRIEEERKSKLSEIWVKKINGRYFENGKEVPFKGNYKIIRDSVIVISVSNSIGIEGFRIVLKPDSIGMIDRMAKKYYYGDYQIVQRKLQYKIGFMEFQSILMNDFFLFQQSNMEEIIKKNERIEKSEEGFIIKREISLPEEYGDVNKTVWKAEQNIILDKYLVCVRKIEIIKQNPKERIIIEYSDFTEIADCNFPGSIKVDMEDENRKVMCSMKLSKIMAGEKFNIGFNVGEKYERIRW